MAETSPDVEDSSSSLGGRDVDGIDSSDNTPRLTLSVISLFLSGPPTPPAQCDVLRSPTPSHREPPRPVQVDLPPEIYKSGSPGVTVLDPRDVVLEVSGALLSSIAPPA